ncbi:MAG: hypothetical protein VW274_04945, partial [Thalassolituus sp.]
MLLRTKALLVGCTLLLAACEPQPAEPAAPLSVTSFSFNLVDTTSTPLVGVNVAEMVDGSSLSLGQTSDAGSISVVDHETGQLTVTFAKEGYAPQVWTGDLQAPQAERIVMIQREAAQTIAAGEAADVEGKDGASVEVAADAFVGADGLPYTGPINVNITPVDIASDATEAAAFPGSFNAVLESGAEQPLITYGTVEYHFTDENGNELQLAEGQTATIEIPIYTLTHPDGSTIQVGDVISFWYLDEETGIWHEDGAGTVVASESSPTGLAQRGEVSHFTWWNCDVSPNPATVTIETTLPDFPDRAYRIEYSATPLNSRFSRRVDSESYTGSGLATYSSYIPENTLVRIGIKLYRYLDDQRISYVLVDSVSEEHYFAADDEYLLEYDFSGGDAVGEVFIPNISINLFSPSLLPIEPGSQLTLIPANRYNFKLAEVIGGVISTGNSAYILNITQGPEWLSEMLSIDELGTISLVGQVPEFENQSATISVMNLDGTEAASFTLELVSGVAITIDNPTESLELARDDSVSLSPISVSGGYPGYSVSLLPVSQASAAIVSVSEDDGNVFSIT